MQTYDAIVVGVGGMGSAALYHLARRGARVLGIEQFGEAHDRGSSHGRSRVLRRAYFEHADYVPLLDRSYRLWDDLEARAERKLVERCGLAMCGAPGSKVIAGVRRAREAHSLDVREWGPAEVEARLAGFRIPEDHEALFEPDAGILYVEECVRAHCAAAAAAGAEVHWNETIGKILGDAGGVRIETDRDSYHAARLIVCAGPWTGRLLAALQLPLEVRRTFAVWYACERPSLRLEAGLPVFVIETPESFFYGIPALDERGVKLGEHVGRQLVEDPGNVDRELHPADVVGVEDFLERYLPGMTGARRDASICMYTMTPDQHFIVDRHPHEPAIVFAAGFSGHGFKFAPAIGSALAELALEDSTDESLAFLRLDRAGLAR